MDIVHKVTYHFIGDSHVSFFNCDNTILPEYPEYSGGKFNRFKYYRLGAVLAYSLHKEKSSYDARKKLFEIIDNIPDTDYIIFVFGEIDCRRHILKQEQLRKQNYKSITEDVVEKYVNVINEVKIQKKNIIVFGPIASGPGDSFDETSHYYGTQRARNKVTAHFNELLKNKCNDIGVNFISIFSYLIDENFTTIRHLHFDGTHLGKHSFHFFVRELKKALNKQQLPSDVLIYGFISFFDFIFHKLKYHFNFKIIGKIILKLKQIKKKASPYVSY